MIWFFSELAYFVMIQNYDYFSKWNVKSNEFYTFWNILIYSTMFNTKHVIIMTLISCKRFRSKVLSYEKMKRTKKKAHNLFIK
jgi:hypothetical protein